MYGKIFSSMFEGSLYGHWKAIVTFQQMIVLCGPDGVVDMTPQALAARTSIPLEVIQEGIKVLEAPDEWSRTPEQGGRRIERLDSHRPWGWRIVNYRKYRMMVDAETVRKQNRVRQQAKRERDAAERHAETVTNRDSNACHAKSRQAEAEAEAEAKKVKTLATPTASLVDGYAIDVPEACGQHKLELVKTPSSGVPNCDYQAVVDAYHAELPTLTRVLTLDRGRREHIKARWREVCADDPATTAEDAVKFFHDYFARVARAPFLLGKGSAKPNGDGHIWRADLEWLMRPSNFVKVIEGKYDDKRKTL